jgi:Kef-type K+ transport system membrane component KefB
MSSLETGSTEISRQRKRTLLWTVAAYSFMILTAIVIFLLIKSRGETLTAPPAASGESAPHLTSGHSDVLLQLLIALAAVIITGQILAKIFSYLNQPPVIGEVLAGILLGPSLLGQQASALVLPPSVAPFLGVIAQLGVILYMFTVGLELNPGLLKHRAHATVATSHASIIAPFILGSFLALYLYPRLSNSGVPFTSFALFMGVAMSITAFPVLARILTDRGLHRTDLGVVALSCAATDDVTAWCLLAFVVGVAKAQVGEALMVSIKALVFIAIMFLLLRPVLKRLASHADADRLPRSAVAFVLIALLLSALATESIGIHAIFGAFLLGVIIPSDSAVARSFIRQLEHIVTILFLPAFFAFTGMRTRIDLLHGLDQWLICGLIILVATLGKFGGSFIAARLTGLGWRASAALGTLMNTRGLMELIVLNIGLELRVISPILFSMMILMALASTIAASPVLSLLIPQTRPVDENASHLPPG